MSCKYRASLSVTEQYNVVKFVIRPRLIPRSKENKGHVTLDACEHRQCDRTIANRSAA